MIWFSELGEEYCPPSQYLLPVLESDCGKQNSDCVDGSEEAWQVGDTLHTYCNNSLYMCAVCSAVYMLIYLYLLASVDDAGSLIQPLLTFCCRTNSVTTRRERCLTAADTITVRSSLSTGALLTF